MLCQHCDNAPCEPVCPVYDAYHNPEGLNVQVYNRCVGTRYCANNCPYKVRRFNWFDYRLPQPLDKMYNPDVSVRDRGIMEKCTFCIQRIRAAKDKAKDEERLVQDGEVMPACAQTCPTEAIIFGNLEDKNSKVYKLAHSDKAYRALEELGTQPAVHYLR
jgi:molybdopterin-containing oxidoreductase family iron-sulfur binding subunit